jgi:hypothetical protein
MSLNPVDNEDLFTSVVLAGVPSPGKVTITGHDDKVNWDVKEGTAQSGATITRKSDPPIEFTCTFYLVKDIAQGIDDFAAWDAFRAIVESTVSSPTSPRPTDIYHPYLVEQGITSVVKGTVLGTLDDGKGGQTRAVKFLQYKPPKAVGGTALGSTTKPGPDPNQKALDELQALTTEYQNTPFFK